MIETLPMRSDVLMAEYAKLEDRERRLVGALELENTLLLVEAREPLRAVAAARAAVLRSGVVGVARRAVLDQVNAVPVPTAGGHLFRVEAAGLAGPRLVCFTSGSSGRAKGILRSYESWRRTFILQRESLKYKENTSVLILGDLAHSLHLYGAMEALDRGVAPAILESFSPKLAIDTCRASSLEMMYATPAHLNLLLAYGQKKTVRPLETVFHILAGGAKLDEKQMSRLGALFPNARIVEFFGTTETSYITMKSPDSPTGSVGKACAGVTVKITDAEGRVLSAGQEGILWVKSDMLFDRYVFGEDANTRWRDGFVTVGDQGFLDLDGNLFFTARLGSMVTIAGENVFLDHVENHLRARIQAGECAVLPVGDSLRGCRLVAVTQFAMPEDEAGAVLRALRDEFGALKSPKALVHVANWPFLPSGKTDRLTLAKLMLDRP